MFVIKIAEQSSFCPGVDRAVRIAEETLFKASGPVYSIGPLIHNPEVVSRLREQGLEVIGPGPEELPDVRGVPVIIRSHGIDPAAEQELSRLGGLVVDATCPIVKNAQHAAEELARQGYDVLILGTASHPEVKSIAGRAGKNVSVASGLDEAVSWAQGRAGSPRGAGLVSQTTLSGELLCRVVAALENLVPGLLVRDTICQAVTSRNTEASTLASSCDLVLVVGGRNSSNTARLSALCESRGVPSHHIEQASEVLPAWLERVSSVGVTGGASTPRWQVEQVVEQLLRMGGRRYTGH